MCVKILIMKHIIIGILILMTGCNYDSLQELPDDKIDGKELFSSLYFLNGKAVEKVPQLLEMRNDLEKYQEFSKHKNRIDSINEILVDRITTLDPNFYEEFLLEMQSGEHLNVQDAYHDGIEMLAKAYYDMAKQEINTLFEEIKTYEDNELTELFGDDIEYIKQIRNDEELLKKYLFSDFLRNSDVIESGRKTCLAIAVAVVVVVGGVFDIALSMNVVMAMNYAIHSYTYVNATGNTGQTWMFFNAGVIDWLASWGGGGGGGEDDCIICEPSTDEEIQRTLNNRSLSYEIFINELTENLSTNGN